MIGYEKIIKFLNFIEMGYLNFLKIYSRKNQVQQQMKL